MKPAIVGVLLALGLTTGVYGQRPASPHVLGPGNFLHVVADAERAITFYRDGLGMDVQMPANVAASPGPRPFLTTPEIVKLYNATGGRYRTATAFVQGSPMRAELIEWQDVDRKPFTPRHADPGAGTMIVTVRDLDATLGRVKSAGGTVVSENGTAVPFSDERGRGRAVMVRDLDGFYVQLVQREVAPATEAASDRNAIDIGFAATVDDMDRALRIFNTILGFDLTLDTEEHNESRLRMIGAYTAYYRRVHGVVPGSNLQIELMEVQGINRRHGHSRPQDPGTSILRLRVQDIDRTTEALAGAGVKVVSTGGVPVTLAGASATQRYAIVELPDNLFLQLVQVVPR
jgi:catechol 2,3-dioxygenase-like lactoylglutathione lyase family enzyme